MGLIESKEIINQALNIAIQRGCFGLLEVQSIVKALETLNEALDIQFGEIENL
jgi:hypothetical protein